MAILVSGRVTGYVSTTVVHKVNEMVGKRVNLGCVPLNSSKVSVVISEPKKVNVILVLFYCILGWGGPIRSLGVVISYHICLIGIMII